MVDTALLPCGYTSRPHTASVNVGSRPLLTGAEVLHQCLHHPDHQMQTNSEEQQQMQSNFNVFTGSLGLSARLLS